MDWTMRSCIAATVALCATAFISKVRQMQQDIDKYKANVKQERHGRIRAQQELRELTEELVSQRHESTGSSVSIPLTPIATVLSCFHQCKGAPRQGQLAPQTRGIIMLHDGSNAVRLGRLKVGGWAAGCRGNVPNVLDASSTAYARIQRTKELDTLVLPSNREEKVAHTLPIEEERFILNTQPNQTTSANQQKTGFLNGDSVEGLDEFSHIWILYMFHSNTQTHKTSRTGSKRRPKFISKIAPPVLNGRRVGVLSTRSPHRPTAIGLTVAKVIKVNPKKGWIYVEGIDMLDGTPILDIKPYVPEYDSFPDARIPEWITKSLRSAATRRPVLFTDFAVSRLELLQPTIKDNSTRKNKKNREFHPCLFDSAKDLRAAIEGVLAVDVRPEFQRVGSRGIQPDQSHPGYADPKTVFELMIDGVLVTYRRIGLTQHQEPDPHTCPFTELVDLAKQFDVSVPQEAVIAALTYSGSLNTMSKLCIDDNCVCNYFDIIPHDVAVVIDIQRMTELVHKETL